MSYLPNENAEQGAGLNAVNGIELDYTQEDLIDIILQTASGHAKADALLDWIIHHQT